MRYLVMQIGCIECRVSSYPIRICETIEEAEKIRENHPDTWESEGGDGYVEIIDLTSVNKEEQDK